MPARRKGADLTDAEELRALGALGLSGVVQIRVRDEVHLESTMGLADERTGAPMTASTVSDIGSVSKQFTAAAIMVLADNGLLAPEDRLDRFFDETPADKRAVTVHQLLTHTAGLPGAHFNSDFEPMDAAEAARRILELPLLAPPGTRFAYSNSGYGLLGVVVERVSGQDYRSFVRETLFAPAGLRRTGWYNDPALAGEQFAHGYASGQDHGSPHAFPGPTWALLANGGMLSTVEDLHRWVHALRHGDVLSDEASRRMYTPSLADYAYGWLVTTDENGRRLIAHDGASIYGHSASLARYDDEQVTVAALFNATYRGLPAIRVANPILTDRLRRRGQRRIPRAVRTASDLSALMGLWRDEHGALFEVWAEGRDRVLFGAASPDAVALLVEEDAGGGHRRAALDVTDAMLAGDHTAIAPHLRPDVDDGEVRRTLAGAREMICGPGSPVWRQFAGAAPTRDDERVLWAPQSEDGELTSYLVRIGVRGGDNDVACVRTVWDGDRVVGLESELLDVRHPVAVHLAEGRDGALIGLNLLADLALTLRPAADGSAELEVAGRTRCLSPVWPP